MQNLKDIAEQVKLLKQMEDKSNEVIGLVESLSKNAECLSDISIIKDSIELFKDVHNFRDIYTENFDCIAEDISQNRDGNSKGEQDFLTQYAVTQAALYDLDKAILGCYMTENVANVNVEEMNEHTFQVRTKVKNISPQIIEEAMENYNKRGKYQVDYATLTDQEDKLYVYSVRILCTEGEVDKAISAIRDVILFTLKLMCKYQTYRDDVYQNVYCKLLVMENELTGTPECTLGDFTPRQWQKEAFEAWKGKGANYHGTFSVCTGAGKTKFSLYCIQKILEEGFDLKTSIIVPTRAIMQVWFNTLTEEFHVSPKMIGRRGDGHEKCYWNDKSFIIYISNTAQKELTSDTMALEEFSKLYKKNYYQCIIADECHHYASEKNIKMFDGLLGIKFDKSTGIDYFSMGLSATPERYDKKEKHFYERIGDIVYNYNLLEALVDGAISPFTIENIDCPLNPKEEEKLAEYTKRYSMAEGKFAKSVLDGNGTVASFVNSIRSKDEEEGSVVGAAFGVIGEYSKKLNMILKKYDELKNSNGTKGESSEFKTWLNANDDNKVIYYAYKLVDAYNSRRSFIQNAKSREEKCLKLAMENINRKVIIFCEQIESADNIYKTLTELYGNEKVRRYYSATKKQSKNSRWEVYQREKENRLSLEAFVHGNAHVIVTVKSFNEGVDVSSADVAIVYQNTVSVRESIQRLGRIVRKPNVAEIKKDPILYNLYSKKQKEREYLKDFFTLQLSDPENKDTAKIKKYKKGLKMITLLPKEAYKK